MDSIQYEILEDGTITIETDKISGKNHQSADELLDQLADMMGSVDIKEKKGHVHAHAHTHKHGKQDRFHKH